MAFDGPPRAPLPIYNEKWPISLGEIVQTHGEIDDASMTHLLNGIDRFIDLARYMDIRQIKAVATAAIREASNGSDFIRAAARRDINIRLLSGEEEARAAALGVFCNSPQANGYVADLGGGSLEISRLKNGEVSTCISLPLGTAILANLDEGGWQTAQEKICAAISAQLPGIEENIDLFTVGGTWRAIAHLHQHLSGYPLSILSHYPIAPSELADLTEQCRRSRVAASLAIIPDQRLPLMLPAARMLEMLAKILKPRSVISSALGIREGLLMAELDESELLEDPLLASARFSGQRLARRNFNGDRLFAWMQPLFEEQDQKGDARLRHAACLLADCAWNIHPDYRSAHALQIGIEGNWLGVSGRDRAVIARALWSAYGDSNNDRALLSNLAKRKALRQADKWGLAIRLGMRIDGGTGSILDECKIGISGEELQLSLPAGNKSLRGEAIAHRVEKLAKAMGKQANLDGLT